MDIRKKSLLIFLVAICFQNVKSEENSKYFSENLKIKNKTNTSIYVATYYQKNFFGFECERSSIRRLVEPYSSVFLQRPSFELLKDRLILFSVNKKDLKRNLNRSNFEEISNIEIGTESGDKFYLLFKNSILQGYNSLEWGIIKPISDMLQQVYDPMIDSVVDFLVQNDYSNKTVSVRSGFDVPAEEKEFLKYRGSFVKKKLETLLNLNLSEDQVPNIAFCFSGGGYRAMIGTLGAMLGADKMGLLDCATYTVGLSGSTWLLSPWISMAKSISKYRDILRKKVQVDITYKPIDLSLITESLLLKILLNQDLSLVDLYGSILADDLLEHFGEDRQRVHFSDFATSLKNGRRPLPICTAAEVTYDEQDWIEFTPYEVGSVGLRTFVPTWAFGREFFNGWSRNFAPEQSLGFLMGIWGSAFTASLAEAVEQLRLRMITRDFWDVAQYITEYPPIGDLRVSPAKVCNFMYGLKDSPMSNVQELTLVDAGVDFNLPFPPLLRDERNIDIIIACDYSLPVKNGKSLRQAEEYANRNNLKFPKINYENIEENVISVFKDESDLSVPVVIYLPLIKNDKFDSSFNPSESDFCGTLNFEYENNEFDLLSGLTEFNLLSAKDRILDVIREVIRTRS